MLIGRNPRPAPRHRRPSGHRLPYEGELIGFAVVVVIILAIMGFWIYDVWHGPGIVAPVFVLLLLVFTYLRIEGHIEWRGSRRSRTERAERESKRERLRGLADADPDLYEAIISGRVVMDPYILNDDDRLAEYVHDIRESRGVPDRRKPRDNPSTLPQSDEPQ